MNYSTLSAAALMLLTVGLTPLPAEEVETIFAETPGKIKELCSAPNGTTVTVTRTGDQETLTVTGGIAACPLEVPDGETLRISALVKGDAIERREKGNFIQGGRFGSYWSKPRNTWFSANVPLGSFDWMPISFKVDVPLGTTRLQLQLGLKEASGSISFRNIRVEVVK